MPKEFYDIPFKMEIILEPVFPQQSFTVPVGGPIEETIRQCAASGGGTVVVPTGDYQTSGPLHLSSNMHLHFEEGAVVTFSDKPEDYLPVVFTRWEGMECYNYSPLIYANGCSNIAVTGAGILQGNGNNWWSWKQLQQAAADELCYAEYNNIPVDKRIYGTTEAALRPSFIQFVNCKDVLMEGFTIVDGPQWTVHPVYCENVIIRGLCVRTNGHNTDGINPDSCKNVLIENCDLSTGDDCIAINAGMNEDGWRVNRPCENIYIRNCRMTKGHGGIVFGSAVSGSIHNVYAHNCHMDGLDIGIRFKSMRGRGGEVSNIIVEDMEINNINLEPIRVNMFYSMSTVIPKSDVPSTFKNITFRNIRGNGAEMGILLKGLPEKKMESITLENINLQAKTCMSVTDVTNLTFNNVNIIIE